MMKTYLPRYNFPYYVIDEGRLRKNMEIIASVAQCAGVEMIVALKACAMWSIFPVMREYIRSTTASSLSEAMLSVEQFGSLAHTYAPVYIEAEFEQIMDCSSHITFNSLSQFERFGGRALSRGISCGLRINPEYSPVTTDLYNPCCDGSRLGISADDLRSLPDGVDGLHFHALCESQPSDLHSVLMAIEERFGHLLAQLKWINMGGGHLITYKEYDKQELIKILIEFKSRHPHLRIILEPGSAFTWEAGELVAKIEDIVTHKGIITAIVNLSFACHMPDCLEMPYKPKIKGAHEPCEGERRWRVGGNSCLAGDFCGDWAFDNEPKVGDQIIFQDMAHYTMVKSTMFNGITHPSIVIRNINGDLNIVREFDYQDYKGRMS